MTLRIKLLPALAALLTLSACFGGRGPSEHLTLRAEQTRPAGVTRSAGDGQTITVVNPTTPDELNNVRIPVYRGEQTIQYLRDATWSDTPSILFRQVLSETIAASGKVVLDPKQFTHDPGRRMTGQLMMFGLDETRMEAVAVYDATIGLTGGGVTTRRFESRISVSAIEPTHVAQALNVAANRIASEVSAWLG
jgi:cholesterol transport system auxiliary component